LRLSYTPSQLLFRRPFRIAHGIRSSTPVIFTKLEHDGFTGYGEACMPPYLGESHATAGEFLQRAIPVLNSFRDPSRVEEILSEIDKLSEKDTAAKASIDIALHDLIGKIQNIPCWKLFGLEKEKTPVSTYTFGIDEEDVMKEKIKESSDFPILKVKLNGENDKALIEHLRHYTDKMIAVDVNQGWKKKEEALDMIYWLKEKNILFIEQPLPVSQVDDAAWLFEKSPLPIYGDESIQRLKDVSRLKDVFHGINIKLMKCTGINEARKMIELARELKLKVLIGCMSETSCGVSAAAQLSPLADHADLDGPLLISNDPFDGIKYLKGKIVLSERPGIGAIQKEE
jgi:L-alanine-DL-glutamate epimerase-like enolase superfamily enzyme